MAADARFRALAPRTPKLRRDQIHAVTALVESGVELSDVNSLADLVSSDNFGGGLQPPVVARMPSIVTLPKPWSRSATRFGRVSLTSAAKRGASIFKLMDQSWHRSTRSVATCAMPRFSRITLAPVANGSRSFNANT